jgi:hypothetical protein
LHFLTLILFIEIIIRASLVDYDINLALALQFLDQRWFSLNFLRLNLIHIGEILVYINRLSLIILEGHQFEYTCLYIFLHLLLQFALDPKYFLVKCVYFINMTIIVISK